MWATVRSRPCAAPSSQHGVAEARAQGRDERFLRTFEFYLASREASYEDRYNGDVQLLFSRPEARRAPLLGAV